VTSTSKTTAEAGESVLDHFLCVSPACSDYFSSLACKTNKMHLLYRNVNVKVSLSTPRRDRERVQVDVYLHIS